MTTQRDLLRRTLSAQGILANGRARETVGRHRPAPKLPVQADGPHLPSDSRAELVLGEEIGRGGMATVWAALQTSLGREVAVKRSSDPSDKEAELLLVREAIVAGKLEHPNVVPIHQLIVDEHGPAVVMKRVAGKSWDRLIEDPSTTLETQLEIFLQVLNAVGFAHSRGVLHRDIKPENVMIGDFGQVYLMDWGVAKLRDDPEPSAIVGTPCYMAPEMADGRADERTDVFLLGATLHEVLTGEPRHAGESTLEVLYAAMYVEPYAYSTSVPSELAEICNRACAHAPADRFPSVAALREAALAYRQHRAANELYDVARNALESFRSAALARPGDAHVYAEIQRLFSETRLAFDVALRAWPESPHALQGCEVCLQLMIDCELRWRHLEASASLLAMLRAPDEQRRAKVDALAAELAEERARVAHIERDRDPQVGALARTRAYLGMGIATALMTVVLLVRRMLLPEQGTSTLRLTLVGGIVLLIMVTVALLWRRFGTFNAINRRIAEISVSTLAVSFASRLSGHLTHVTPERVLITDAFILGLGGLALTPYHRAGPWLSCMAFLVAAVGTLQPSVVDDLFIVLSVLVPCALLLLKRKELRAPHERLSNGIRTDP